MSERTSEHPVDSRNWTEIQVQRATRNSLVWNGISLGCLLFLVWLTGDYLYYFFRGPVRVTDEQLLTILDRNRDREPIEYVEMPDRTLIETNWQEVSTSDGRPYSTVPFFLLPVGDQTMILVLADSRDDGKQLLGPLSGARDLDLRVIAKVIQKHPEYADRIQPVVLSNVAAFNVAGYVLMVIMLPWGAYCLRNVIRAVMARVNPASHSIERQLSRLGDAAALAAKINEEMTRPSVRRFGKSILTDSWILRPTVFGAQCVQLVDVVWAYHLQRTSESFVVLCLRNGKVVAVFLKAAQCDELVAAIAERAPAALTGYDPDRMKLWQKNRQEFLRRFEAGER
ncbi:MAG: hypothetical protein JSS49_13935 [Planctomycetes bacterium]|nr:hypothetical protein [Planctomycetota bacterium]